MKDKQAGKRRRRSREDVDTSIRNAARTLFAERGFSATTTREIAQTAQVSETLLFRYYGDKARLFDAVIYGPFTQTIHDFIHTQSKERFGDGPDPYLLIYELLEENRELLRALVFGGPPPDRGPDEVGAGFEPFLQESIADLQRSHHAAGFEPDFDVDTGVRLAFGMMASAVLMQDWLFPPENRNRDHLVSVLEVMVQRALSAPFSATPTVRPAAPSD